MSRPRLWIFVFSLSLGVITGEFWRLEALWLASAASVGLALMSLRRWQWAGLIILGMCLGIFRIQGALTTSPLDLTQEIGRVSTLTGVLYQPPETAYDQQRLTLSDVEVGGVPRTGKLLVTLPPFPSIPTGAKVEVHCQPESFNAQSRLRYRARGWQARCAAASAVIRESHVYAWRASLGRWQERILSYHRQRFNEPQASLLSGILVGNTDGMPPEAQANFQATGTTHIVALSGFNVTIIITLIGGWLARTIGRRWAWAPALVLIVTFVIMTGASASVVRAAVMTIVVQLGLFLGRPIAVGRLLAYAAMGMISVNPLLLWHDLGFQLSFLATVGLVTLAEPLTAWFRFLPSRFGLRESLSTTVAAIVMTEPLLLWSFGRLSVVAPIVNMLVLPLIPVAMGAGALGLMGLLVPGLSMFLTPPIDALLRLIIWIIDRGASWPQSVVQLGPLWAGMVAACCIFITFHLTRRHAPPIPHP